MRMNIRFIRKPCLFIESIELLYAYVNHIPQPMIAGGPYCIPSQDVSEIMEEACREINRDSELLQYFFTAHSVGRDTVQNTCLAFIMVYSFITTPWLDLNGLTDSLTEKWESNCREPYRIATINRYALGIEHVDSKEPVSLAKELKCVNLSEEFFAILLEGLSDYAYRIGLLRELVRPVAEKLSVLLQPYIDNALPLADEWERILHGGGVEALLQNRLRTTVEHSLTSAVFQLQFFNRQGSHGLLDPKTGSMTMLLGVGLAPSLSPEWQNAESTDHALSAIRLLGDRGRSQIIHALRGRAMSLQDLSNCLDMNPGTLFRNLNSMADAHLLDKKVYGSRCYYKANVEYIRSIFAKLMDYYTRTE